MRRLLDDDVLARGPEVPTAVSHSARTFAAQDWFYLHVVLFLIGCFNLAVINAARTPGHWWFWMPVAAWASLAMAHKLWLVARSSLRETRSRRVLKPPSL
jgi:hypothetical protein